MKVLVICGRQARLMGMETIELHRSPSDGVSTKEKDNE